MYRFIMIVVMLSGGQTQTVILDNFPDHRSCTENIDVVIATMSNLHGTEDAFNPHRRASAKCVMIVNSSNP